MTPLPCVQHICVSGETTDAVMAMASERDWEVVRLNCVRLVSGKGRKQDVLQRGDAVQLYEDMHRRPVAVVYEGQPRVRTDPRSPFRDDRAVPLLEFCRYKSFAVSLQSNVATQWDKDFESWLAQIDCEGESDPRVLPFHIFAAKERYDILAGKSRYDLDEVAQRQRFRRVHLHRRGLVDSRKRRWESARAETRHGREPQTVRGLTLGDGFHWDVTMSQSPVLTTSSVTWEVRRGGYINVYPDGHTRIGKGCKQTWSARQSKAADEVERQQSRSRS